MAQGVEMADRKNIVLFLDGTWNTVTTNTNVWRLKSLCATDDGQAVYYSQGVGTQFGEKLRGGMLGYGLDQEVIDAYEWLIQNFNSGDQIFIFGFSRGAYTARSLSGLISRCGLLQSGSPLGLDQLYDRYRHGRDTKSIRELQVEEKKNPSAPLSIEEKWILKYSLAVPIKFVGVWDTVGALGVPFGNIPIISRSNYKFLEVDLHINNDNAYHALAVDEHRNAFAPTLWTRTVPKNSTPENTRASRPLSQVEQRWFVGAHANVGGGYPSDYLAQIPLKWLMDKAVGHGLRFVRDVDIDGDENSAAITDSYAMKIYGLPLYRLFPRYYRPIGAKPVIGKISGSVTQTINETIDVSVFDRWQKDPTYRPKNLLQWQADHKADINLLKQSVRADDPSMAV